MLGFLICDDEFKDGTIMSDTADTPKPGKAPAKAKPARRKTPATSSVPKAKPETAKTKPPKPETAHTKSGGWGIWALLVLVVAGAGTWAAWPQLSPYLGPYIDKAQAILDQVSGKPQAAAEAPAVVAPEPEPSAEPTVDPLAELSARLDAIDARLDALDARLHAVASAAPTSDNAQATQDVQDAIMSVQQTLPTLQGAIGEMSRRLDEVEATAGRAPDPTASAQALVLATTQLRSRLLGEGPFGPELDALERVAGDDQAVLDAAAQLRAHAEAGVPTAQTLSARFAPVAREVMRLHGGDQTGGWMAEVKDALGGLVTIRRTDPSSTSDPTERALALTVEALEIGDLIGAETAMAALEGPPSGAAAAWLGDLRARILAEQALEQLYNHTLSVLDAAGGA